MLLVGHNPIESRGFVVLEVVFSRNFTAWEEHKNVMTAPKAPIVFDMRCDFDVRMEVSLTSQMKLPQRQIERQSFFVKTQRDKI